MNQHTENHSVSCGPQDLSGTAKSAVAMRRNHIAVVSAMLAVPLTIVSYLYVAPQVPPLLLGYQCRKADRIVMESFGRNPVDSHVPTAVCMYRQQTEVRLIVRALAASALTTHLIPPMTNAIYVYSGQRLVAVVEEHSGQFRIGARYYNDASGCLRRMIDHVLNASAARKKQSESEYDDRKGSQLIGPSFPPGA